MLVLTRKPSEQIVLELGDEHVTIRVVSVEGGKVRLGIDAPRSVTVHRQEVFDRVNQWAGTERHAEQAACG